uniref:Reverse transcriptase domain-containing protein n=1 Tax=Nicotiana tabacum TaxID=4097 RepID=A0A1S4ANL9_TOBAC|nr:PREDICTED: uncharacterized protein LOC107799651 [Nicotiana tabacum]
MEVYIDDTLVKSTQAEDHFQHLLDTFEILRKYNMKLNPEKCVFGVASAKPKDDERLLIYLVVSEVAVMRYWYERIKVLADFVADFSMNLVPEAEKELQVFTESDPRTWTLFTDGSSNVKGASLELARELGIEKIVIKSDSQLVVNQMQGTYVETEM